MAVTAQESIDDSVLALHARDGSTAALGALYQRHAPMLFRLSYRLLDSADDAEDVVQDLFVGLPEALRRYEDRGRLDSWLRAIGVRMSLMRLRAGRRLVRDAGDRSGAGEPEAQLTARVTLQAAVAQLAEPLRLVFVLKEVEGYSHAEIAAMLGIRQGTSEVRLHRATRALRATLRRV